MPKNGHFPEKEPKMAILGKKPQKWGFRGFSGPWALPGRPQRGCFYINPSRRGPAAPPAGSGPQSRRDGGRSPKGARGSPPGE